MSQLNNHVQHAVQSKKDRLSSQLKLFPFPAIISIGLILIVTIYLLHGIDPRVGNPAELLTFTSQPEAEGAIWISVSPDTESLVITTSERDVFRLPQNITKEEDVEPFKKYLEKRIRQDSARFVLSKKINPQETTVVIAADQSLKFLHIRPLLYTIASAGITRYAFETKMLVDQDISKNP